MPEKNRKAIERLIACLDDIVESLEDLSKFALNWKRHPIYPNIPKDIHLSPNIRVWIQISKRGEVMLMSEVFGYIDRIYHPSQKEIVVHNIIREVGEDWERLVEAATQLESIKEWAVRTKQEMNEQVKQMFEEQHEYVELLLTEWVTQKLSSLGEESDF